MRTALSIHLLLLLHRDLTTRLEVALRGPGLVLVKLLLKAKKIRHNNTTTLKTVRTILLQKKQSNMKFIWILLPVLSEVFLRILSFSLSSQTSPLNKFKIIQHRFLRCLTITSSLSIRQGWDAINKKNNILFQQTLTIEN